MDAHHKTPSITPLFFLNMLKSGAHNIIVKENLLNELNVFPVSDSDTGLNMASLMRYFLAQNYTTDDLQHLLTAISDTLLIGAYGNSGMIISAFFSGFSQATSSSQSELNVTAFLYRLRNAVKQAYQSVAEPIEGTMLTLMSTWLTAYEQLASQSDDFIYIFNQSFPILENALKQTQFQLPLLTSHHVVDAGALGFFEFFKGMHDCLCKNDPTTHKRIGQHESADIALLAHASHSQEQEPYYHYCTETLLKRTADHALNIKAMMNPLGDCLVTNQNDHYLKVHLHTNNPVKMSDLLQHFGEIHYQKIDSMKLQWEITHHRKHKIALVTDSSADIPQSLINKEQIHILPLQIRLGKNTFLDRYTLTLKKLYEQIHNHNTPASTATPSIEMVSRYLLFLASHYDSIIVMCLSSKLSGTHQVLTNASKKITNIPITIIDTKMNSVAQGLLTLMTARWIAAGYEHQTIIEKIQSAIPKTEIFVAVNEFKTMSKSGRAPRLVGIAANLSQIKPIVSLNSEGKPTIAGLALGQKRCWNKIIKLINQIKKTTSIKSVGIVHTDAHTKANDFATYLINQTGLTINFITEASCAIGLHAGRGCIGVAISSESI